MTEEQIVERVVTEISREVDNATPDDIFICRHHCHAAARAVVALLGPAPLEWESARCSDRYERFTADAGCQCGDCRYEALEYSDGTHGWTSPSHDEGETPSIAAAKAAAEAHHRAAWWAQTVAGRGE